MSVLGTVIRGSKRGRLLGVPTANIDPHHEVLPKRGVYAVKIICPARGAAAVRQSSASFVRGCRFKIGEAAGENKVYNGTCNIGTRPTLEKQEKNLTIEAHIFGFKENIYGRDLEIQFIARLRPERKFPSIKHLVSQIEKDNQKALRILKPIS